MDHFSYRLETREVEIKEVRLFDAEQHNPRNQLHLFEDEPQMLEFLRSASHGQVMLSLFKESFPKLPDGTVLLLDEPEMALSLSNQRRVLKMLMELVDKKNMRIVTRDTFAGPAGVSPHLRHRPGPGRETGTSSPTISPVPGQSTIN